MFDFLKKDEVLGVKLVESTISFLIKKFKQSPRIFTYASAHGQILLVTNNISQNLFYYIHDVAIQNNFATADRFHTVFGLAELVGHSASRGVGAIGEVGFKAKPNAPKDILAGNIIYMTNYSKLKCDFNNLQYIIDIGEDLLTLDLNAPKIPSAKIVQGIMDLQAFQGTGEDIQSFLVQTQPNKFIDDNFSIVLVNGERYPVYKSLRDIPYKAPGCLIKNNIQGGISLIFGKDLVHKIPADGAEIVFNYLVIDGKNGNVTNRILPTFTFLDAGIDSGGEDVNLNDFFSCEATLTPDFGSDPEPMELTKLLAPNVQKNAIIHDKDSIEYYFGRMNYFSFYRAKRREGIDNLNHFDVLLIPKVMDRLESTEDYFSVDMNKFILSNTEKTRLLNAIQEGGIASANINLNLYNPVLKRFSATIFIDAFKIQNSKITKTAELERKIRQTISNYMLENKRINKIPHSDIVRILDEINEVDSVKVVFHPQFASDVDNMGNISLNDDEMAVMRGGFIDENSIEYFDKYDPNDGSVGCVNVTITLV